MNLDSELLLRELTRAAAYPFAVERVEARRTLVSLLFFAGERVYKVKQAVDLGFIDATNLERRRELCAEEVRLNAALAPGVHLGVVPVTRAEDGHLRMGGAGDPVEWAVEMVRLPADRMLAHLLERGVIDNDPINALVDLLVDFHARSATGPGVDEHGTPRALAVSVEENFEQLVPFVRGLADRPEPAVGVLSAAQHAFLRVHARGFLATHRDLLQARVAAGRIREGHGDLHAENVCLLPEGPLVYDRIEFNRRFRCLDVASDVAFLAMDLDHRGFPGFAGYFAHRYAEKAGDPGIHRLLGFYKAYRATVRGKVAALQTPGARTPDRREELRRESMRYLQLALGYDLEPSLVLLCGLPACGKSFLAPHLANPLRAGLLHSDVRRKRLAGMAAETSARIAWGEGLYTSGGRRETYRSLLADAVRMLRSGRSAVVDATFSRRAFRAPFVDAATRLDVPWVLVWITAPEELVRERMAARTQGPSDADMAVYLRERDAFEPPDELPGGHVVGLVSSGGAPEDMASRFLDVRVSLERGAVSGGRRGS